MKDSHCYYCEIQMINFANNLILDFEKDSDRRISAICRAITVLNVVVILLEILHIFKISSALYPTLIVSAVILLMPTLFYDILGLHSKFIRYLDEYEALAIPGGFEEYGFYEEAYDERFLELIREFHSKRKIITSICVGALPIGKSGVLKNRAGTTYHLNGGYRQKQLAEFGVHVMPDERIVIDDNIITSFCAETAADVGFVLLSLLVGAERAEIVKIAMGFGNGMSMTRSGRLMETAQ